MTPGEAREALEQAARAAGRIALGYFREGRPTSAEVRWKNGSSPVSDADLAADETLRRLLALAWPEIGWVSEESRPVQAVAGAPFFVVDPIDGTRAFIEGDPQWAVSLALVEGGRPVAGVVHAPALGLTFAAHAGGGATVNGRPARCRPAERLRGALVGGPRFLLDRLAAEVGVRAAPRTPSLALRLARVAEGALDAAIASEGSHDWDIAAADVILAEAGGLLLDRTGATLAYPAPGLRRGALASGAPGAARALVDALGLHR